MCILQVEQGAGGVLACLRAQEGGASRLAEVQPVLFLRGRPTSGAGPTCFAGSRVGPGGRAGFYSSAAYAVAQGTVETPFALAQCMLYAPLTYFIIGFEYSAGASAACYCSSGRRALVKEAVSADAGAGAGANRTRPDWCLCNRLLGASTAGRGSMADLALRVLYSPAVQPNSSGISCSYS